MEVLAPSRPGATEVSTIAVTRAAGGATPRPAWVEEATKDPALEFVAREWDKSASTPDAWFDSALADKIVGLWPQYFRHTEGKFYNKPFLLRPWQEAIVRLLVGWRNADGTRLYRRLLLWVGKKSGKSEFLAALALLFWVFDREYGGQGFCFARNEAQALKIVFKKMKAMIGMCPQLAADIQVFKKSLYCSALGESLFEVLAGNAEGRQGIAASVVVGDEMHEWRDDLLVTALHQSTAARAQPIEIYGSTAGIKGKGYGWDLWEETVSLIEGRLHDNTTLAVIFAVPAEADWTDESLWPLANPNLGISPTIQYLRAECAKAKVNPRLEAAFRRYHLNQWVSALTRWIPVVRWDLCAKHWSIGKPDRAGWQELPDLMKGRSCFSMIDLSKTRDVTAEAHLFPPIARDDPLWKLDRDDELWRLVLRFFIPEDTIEERVKRDRVKYDEWHRIKALEATPGDWVDQGYIKSAIQEDSKSYTILKHGYDPWGATKLAQELIEEGAPMIEVRQGIQTLGEASAEFEKLVYAGQLDHGGHPMMRWMVDNVVLYNDRNGNFKPDKAKSSEKIDGVVATIGALALAMKADSGPNLDDFLANAVMR